MNIEIAIHEIEYLSLQFRKMIESIDWSGNGIMKSFPHGTCGIVSEMLGMFLCEKIEINCLYVSGERGIINRNWTSHAWLMYNNYYVDITCDQFDDCKK